MQASATWVPILTAGEAAEADRSISEITQDLGGEEWSPRRMGPSLSGGNAGLAIFYDELFRLHPDPEFQLHRDQRWDAAIEELAQSDFVRPNLYSGFTGVGWVTALLSSRDEGAGPEPSEDETHKDLEDALLELLQNVPTPADYDLINGPAGWGLYSLERWPHPRAVRALELTVDFFEARAERVADGVRWWTAPELLPEWQRENAPNGYFNLGLSHGIPGICVILAQALARGIRPGLTARLLEGAVSWVLGQRIAGATGLSFPSVVVEGKVPSPSRLAWCYGDLGVASALWVAGQVSGNKSWSANALSIARRAATVPLEGSGAVDAGLCHGTSGIAHLFNRFYQETGEDEFRAAARAWIEATLKMWQEGIGPGGYAAWRRDPTPGWLPTAGLLEGSSGVGLALIAAMGDWEPTWDRFLFASPVSVPALPPGGN